MPNLNRPQRIFLAIVGLAILLFQFYKFTEDGIEGTGWVIAVVAGALLIVPALTLWPEAHRTSSRNGDAVSGQTLPRPSGRAEDLLARAVLKAQALHRQLPLMMDLPPLQAPEFRQINALMTDSWLQYCLAYTGCLSLMTEWKKDARFPKKPAYAAVWAGIVEHMVQAEAATAKRHGLTDKYNPTSSKQWATRDMNEAELAMRKFVDRLAVNIPDPDAPFVDYLVTKIHVPEPLQKGFSEQVHKFTKEALREFATV